eukprot:GHVH01000328.1.p1 GENE.GHVH01000328.1~~GHVH01000328.1.p1  ORF type:complete len:778 (-),score=87.74 GHVH01000328.1:641-2974(-)
MKPIFLSDLTTRPTLKTESPMPNAIDTEAETAIITAERSEDDSVHENEFISIPSTSSPPPPPPPPSLLEQRFSDSWDRPSLGGVSTAMSGALTKTLSSYMKPIALNSKDSVKNAVSGIGDIGSYSGMLKKKSEGVIHQQVVPFSIPHPENDINERHIIHGSIPTSSVGRISLEDIIPGASFFINGEILIFLPVPSIWKVPASWLFQFYPPPILLFGWLVVTNFRIRFIPNNNGKPKDHSFLNWLHCRGGIEVKFGDIDDIMVGGGIGVSLCCRSSSDSSVSSSVRHRGGVLAESFSSSPLPPHNGILEAMSTLKGMGIQGVIHKVNALPHSTEGIPIQCELTKDQLLGRGAFEVLCKVHIPSGSLYRFLLLDATVKCSDSTNLPTLDYNVQDQLDKVELMTLYARYSGLVSPCINFRSMPLECFPIRLSSHSPRSSHSSLSYIGSDKGWDVFHFEEEWRRLGVEVAQVGDSGSKEPLSPAPSGVPLVISFVNQYFQLCQSYPSLIVVPSTLTSEQLTELSSFRTKSRFPVASWRCQSSGATLWRCAQPKAMLGRCHVDEYILNQLLAGSNPVVRGKTERRSLLILDARPYINAFAQKASGAGFEATGGTNHYSRCVIEFAAIPNVHVVRSSYDHLNQLLDDMAISVDHHGNAEVDLKDSTNVKRYHEASNDWMGHIMSLLNGGMRLTEELGIHKSHAVVHCTDGWDRTAQLTSLAMLCLDPFYRTGRGFCQLVEKEFIQGGHRFQKRAGKDPLASSNDRDVNRSPIFVQWLSSWQTY